MNYFQRFFGHLKTINKHKFLVMKLCFQCGMIKQGLLHDLSKWSPAEFFPSVKYYQGFQSPITKEKLENGYSECWLHHKGRNKHHWEYWIDRLGKDTTITVIQIPLNYVLEMICDKMSASKTYNGKKYTDQLPIQYFRGSYEYHCMNPHNVKQIDYLLQYLADNGEKKTLKYIKGLYKAYKKDKNFDIIEK